MSGAKWVIDLAAGRGADLHRYQEIGVGNALFIDIDATAIAELIRRKFSFFADKKRAIRAGAAEKFIIKQYDNVHNVEYEKLIVKDVKALTVHTLVANLKMSYLDLIASTYQYGINPGMVNGIVCNFALHYLCDSIENIRNILLFCATMISIGDPFIFTVMDGAAVFKLLKDFKTGQTWEVKENGVPKYALTKKYSGEKLATCGQMVSVLLPFSDNMYDEPLCNIETVIAEATSLGFAVELNASMSSRVEDFKKFDKTLYDRLTADDKMYIGLFKYVSMRMVKPTKKVGGMKL